jgi:hypothetical protein
MGELGMDEILFTSAAVLEFLSKIDELKDKDLSIDKTINDKIQITIGDSVYEISDDNATTVEVPEESLYEISDATVDAYEELLDEQSEIVQEVSTEETTENIEGGIIKELAKDLMLGGLIRFAKNKLL